MSGFITEKLKEFMIASDEILYRKELNLKLESDRIGMVRRDKKSSIALLRSKTRPA